ncbi:MAG: hypothetical protein ACHQAX_05570 [Gammaproteobacteria bacterium]
MPYSKDKFLSHCGGVRLDFGNKFYKIESFIRDLLDEPSLETKLTSLTDEQSKQHAEFVASALPGLIDSLDSGTITDNEKKNILRSTVPFWERGLDGYHEAFGIVCYSLLKKQWNFNIFEALLSRPEQTSRYLRDIFNKMRGKVKQQDIQSIYDLFIAYSDEELAYVSACINILWNEDCLEIDIKLLRDEMAQLIAGKKLSDWYEAEINQVSSTHDPQVLIRLLGSPDFKQYAQLPRKKRLPSIIEVAIMNEFDGLSAQLINGQNSREALSAAIRHRKMNLFPLCRTHGALTVSPSPLKEAYDAGHMDIITMLIELGADIDQDNFFRSRVLSYMGSGYKPHDDSDLVISLIKTKKSKYMGCALKDAICDENLELAKLLCENGAHVQRNAIDKPPLLRALQEDALKIIPVLLDFGQTFDEEYEGKKIWDYINDYDVSKSNLYKATYPAEYQEEIPLIRESLREILVALSNKTAQFTDIRAELKNGLACQMNQQAILNKTSACKRTYYFEYNKSKLYGNASESTVEPTFWSKDMNAYNSEGYRPNLHEVLEHLIGEKVTVTFSSYGSSTTWDGILRWRSSSGFSDGSVCVDGYSVDIKSIYSIKIVKNEMKNAVEPKKNSNNNNRL